MTSQIERESSKVRPEIMLGLDTTDKISVSNLAYLKQTLKAEKIVNAVFTFYGIPYHLSKVKSLKNEFVKARQITIYIASKETELSDSSLGALVSRERTTIIFHLRTVKERMEVEKLFKEEVGFVHRYVLSKI